MTDFFYLDPNGQKQGPVGEQQLKELAKQGVITAQTLLETDAGHRGTAGQIPGLFPTPAPNPFNSGEMPPAQCVPSPVARTSKPVIFAGIAVVFLVLIGLGGMWAMSSSFRFTADERMEISAFLANPESVGKSQDVLLSWQAGQGNLTVVKYLLSKGTDVNAKPKELDGFTPLHSAAMNGYLEVAKFLVGKGADVNAKSSSGLTPILLAASGGHLDVVKFLVEKGVSVKGNEAVHAAMLSKNWDNIDEVVRYIISQGGDANTKDENGETPLFRAVLLEHIEDVKFFISKGADVNAKDNYGRTPLHKTQFSKNIDTAKFLVSKGADISANSNTGKTPIDAAKEENNTVIVEYLSSLK